MLLEVDEWLVTQTGDKRSASADSLKEALGKGAVVAAYPDITSACEHAKLNVNQADRVLVFGSFYLVGPAMSTLGLYFGSS